LDSSSTLSCPKPSSVTTKRPAATTRKSLTTTRRSSGSSTTLDSDNVVLKAFEVQVGQDGTKDIVRAKVCSYDKKVCCETLQLNKRQGNNWVRNGNATWPGTTLGLCKDKVFPTKTRTTITNLLETKLVLTLNKSGNDGMKLENFNIDAVSAVGSQKRRFKCGKVVIDSKSNKATKECYAQFPKSFGATTKKAKTTTRPPFRSGSG